MLLLLLHMVISKYSGSMIDPKQRLSVWETSRDTEHRTTNVTVCLIFDIVRFLPAPDRSIGEELTSRCKRRA